MVRDIYTTVVIGKSGRVYDLGSKEIPGESERPPQNAFTCPKGDVSSISKRAPRLNKVWTVHKEKDREG